MDLNLILKNIVNESIAPLLKSLSFKKNGYHFYREVGDVVQCVNIQQSKWKSTDYKEFTINIGLLHKEIFNTHLNKELPKFPKEYDCLIRIRLPYLKYEKDNWYELDIKTEFASLVNHINNDLLDYLIPFLQKYEKFENWIEFVTCENASHINDTTKFFLLMELNELEDASKLLVSLYKKSLIPTIRETSIMNSDNTWSTIESESYINWNIVNYIKELALKYNISVE